MRHPHVFVLLGLVAPFTLAQMSFTGCIPTGTTDGAGGTGSTVFNLPPTVRLAAIPDPPRGVAPLTVQFNSADSTDDGVIVDRLWDFGDGQTSRDISPSHIFQRNGTYTVKLTLTDDAGAKASRSLIVTVTERPVAIIQVDRDSADAAPARFEFDATASYDPDGKEGDKLRYRWDFGDGAREVLAAVAHTYTRAGTYRIVLTVTDATGVTGTAEKFVQVGIPRPTVTFRTPPEHVRNVVCGQDPAGAHSAPLWVQVVFQVEPGVPYKLRAGLRDTGSNQEYVLDKDARDGVTVNDLPLTLPTPLDVSQMPVGSYNLWAEVLTDRSAPARTYSGAIVHITEPFTSNVSANTPTLPALSNEEWYVFMRPSGDRQVFDLGALNLGDRLFVSLVDAPGFGRIYGQSGFSLLMLDASQKMFAWYEDRGALFTLLGAALGGYMGALSVPDLFTPDARLIVGRNTNHFYFVSEGHFGTLAPHVYVRIQRGAAIDSSPRKQVVYLNFNGAGSEYITVANSKQFQVPAFSLRGTVNDNVVIGSAVARVAALLQPYNFELVVSTPVNPVAPPVEPHAKLYFDTSTSRGLLSVVGTLYLQFFGLSDYLDPRAVTAAGQGVIAVRYLDQRMRTLGYLLSDAELGTAIGNAAVHHIGFMSGLRETSGVNEDIMLRLTAANELLAKSPGLDFTIAPLAPSWGQTSVIGIQDAPQLLRELFRK